MIAYIIRRCLYAIPIYRRQYLSLHALLLCELTRRYGTGASRQKRVTPDQIDQGSESIP